MYTQQCNTTSINTYIITIMPTYFAVILLLQPASDLSGTIGEIMI